MSSLAEIGIDVGDVSMYRSTVTLRDIARVCSLFSECEMD